MRSERIRKEEKKIYTKDKDINNKEKRGKLRSWRKYKEENKNKKEIFFFFFFYLTQVRASNRHTS